jgi:hypothetical protein
MTNLALDLARVSGAAWEVDGVYVTMCFTLGKRGDVDGHVVCLYGILRSLVASVRPEKIVCENDIGRGSGSRTLQAYHTVARLVAAEFGIPFEYGLNSSSARRHAFGTSIADKELAARHARLIFPIPRSATADEIDAIILLEAVKALDKERAFAAMTKKQRKRRAA